MPLVEALESVAGATGNIVYEQGVLKMRDEVATGQRLQQSMENTDLFPNMVIQMIAVGEDTGALDSMLGKIADFYDQEVEATTESLMALLEPIMILVLGGIVGAMIIAMYMPIFKIFELIQ